MSQPIIQSSFNSGEWAPSLNARVDLQKYHSSAALLENFFVDYRGGASTRPGTRYILQCFKSNLAVRIVKFQISFTLGFILEFGDEYLRIFNNGVPVLEATKNITNATQADPCVLTINAHGWSVGDWIFVTGVLGMTQLNDRYFRIKAETANTVTLSTFDGHDINATGYSPYTSGGTAQRILTLESPYSSDEIFMLKFAQDVNQLIICHPDHRPYVLIFESPSTWTLEEIEFGTNIDAPDDVTVTTTMGSGVWNYSYIVTAVGSDGQESVASIPGLLSDKDDLRTVAAGGSNQITWDPVTGADRYNVYRAVLSHTYAIPAGAVHGYIGEARGNTFIDTNIAADFTDTPPVANIPFYGSGVTSYTITNRGTYSRVPVVNVESPSGTSPATATASLRTNVVSLSAAGTGYAINDTVTFTAGLIITVNTVGGGGEILTFTVTTRGTLTSGNTPANPLAALSTSGLGTGATVGATWELDTITPVASGAGYTTAPAVTFTPGGAGAAATAVLGAATDLNPAVPGFYQQRLFLGALDQSPQSFFMSQPGAKFNFNISQPAQADDSVSGTIVAGIQGAIKSATPMPSGLIVLTDSICWQINGGNNGEAIAPDTVSANPHSYVGSNDMPPIVANFDILFVQAKGSSVRDLSYNFYSNIFTGTDITIASSHLFYDYQLVDWAFAEEPFKIIWAVRNDGVLLSCTFLKEQEFIAWSHSNTQGLYKSVATNTETIDEVSVEAVYVVVEREVNNNTVKYIERFVERSFPDGVAGAWCVDAGIQYDGAPETDFDGAEHLGGLTCTGLADGQVIPEFVMANNGEFSLDTAASLVTVGAAYECNLKTLAIDTGNPTIQGKLKKNSEVTVRVADTLGLWIGSDENNLVAMKDLVRGNVGSQSNTRVTDLVTTDATAYLDPKWDPFGQFYIRQPYPMPATILGVIPYVLVENAE